MQLILVQNAIDLDSDIFPYLRCMLHLSKNKETAHMLTESELWWPSLARSQELFSNFERQALLGPLFRLTACPQAGRVD